MGYYRFHNFSVTAEAPVGATFALLYESLAKADVINAPLRFCFTGTKGCSAILARFPELANFFVTERSGSGGILQVHLSNFGPSAPLAWAGPAGVVVAETIMAVAGRIPSEFPITWAMVVVGPIGHATTPVESSPPLSSRLPLAYPHCVRLSWQSSPTRRGQRYFLTVVEPVPSADSEQAVPAWVQRLYSAFPGSVGQIVSDIETITSQYGMVVTRRNRSFVGSKSIAPDLKLPHDLPDAKAASQLESTPLRGVRSLIVRLFANDGWKESSGRKHAGVYKLWKRRARGRRLNLTFRVEKSGPSPRTIFGTIELMSESGTMKLRVLAERSVRREFEVPNQRVLGNVLDNMRVVVRHLEDTWLAELENALGATPTDYRPSGE